jgi:hypothetical protein
VPLLDPTNFCHGLPARLVEVHEPSPVLDRGQRLDAVDLCHVAVLMARPSLPRLGDVGVDPVDGRAPLISEVVMLYLTNQRPGGIIGVGQA